MCHPSSGGDEKEDPAPARRETQTPVPRLDATSSQVGSLPAPSALHKLRYPAAATPVLQRYLATPETS